MAVKIGINGFGRIGRLVFRAMMEQSDRFDVVAINDLADAEMLAILLRYDSTQGRFPGTVEVKKGNLLVNGKEEFQVLSEKDPARLPWKDMGVDVAVECTGIFRDNKKGDKPGYDSHLDAGAKKVIISAPTKGDAVTIVLGVNDELLTPQVQCVSNASCTTNSLAPVVKVLHDSFGVVKGLMVTCHGYTADQRLQDMIHPKDPRRARAAAINIIPTTTGAAAAVGKVLPELNGKLDGYALRVPVPTGSITDLTVELSKKAGADDINAAMKKAADGAMKGIIEYTEDPIVSTDIIHNPASSVFDAGNTRVIDNMAKVTMWYDNEWGYSCRTADLAERIAAL
jgi:glyceraldehyde 3-phosphate dehydrogenase